jgi:drug/metabolite transporter (DMT)-like permease
LDRLRFTSSVTLEIGIFLALGCAFATNLGFLYKYRGANDVATVSIAHPWRSAVDLFKSKWFAIGMGVAVGAWGLHVAALAMAPMSLVQAVLSGGVVLLAVMAERLFGYKVGPRQWLGVALTGVGLVLLGVTLPATNSAHSQFSLAGMIAFEAGMVAIGALLVAGKRIGAPDHHHGAMLGAASGILFGVSDIAIKAVTGLIGDSGVAGLVSPWMLVIVAASIAAFYASARGLQDGEAVPVITVTATASTVTCIAGGILVFGDPLAGNPVSLVVQLLAFALVCGAAWLTPAPVRAVHETA